MNTLMIIIGIVLVFDAVISVIYFSSIFKRDKAINKSLDDIKNNINIITKRVEYAQEQINGVRTLVDNSTKHIVSNIENNIHKTIITNGKLDDVNKAIQYGDSNTYNAIDNLCILIKQKFNVSNELMIDNLKNLVIKLDENVKNTNLWCENVAQDLAEIRGAIEALNKAKSSSSKSKTTKSLPENTKTK